MMRSSREGVVKNAGAGSYECLTFKMQEEEKDELYESYCMTKNENEDWPSRRKMRRECYQGCQVPRREWQMVSDIKEIK